MTTTPNQAAETSKPIITPAPDNGPQQDNKPTTAPNPSETKK